MPVSGSRRLARISCHSDSDYIAVPFEEGLEKEVGPNGSIGGCVGNEQRGRRDIARVVGFLFRDVFFDVDEGCERRGAGNGWRERDANGEVAFDGAYGIGRFGLVLLFLHGGRCQKSSVNLEGVRGDEEQGVRRNCVLERYCVQ